MSSSNDHKPEILVVLSRFPYPLEKGDKLRAYYQLRELSKSFSITLFATSENRISPEHFAQVEQFCDEVVVHYLSPWKRLWSLFIALFSKLPFQVHYFYASSGKRKIKALIKQKDFKHIYCQLIRCSEYIKNIHHIPKTIDYMDAFSAGVERRVKNRPWYDRWIFRMEAKRLRNYERSIFDFFEFRTIISEQDRNLIAHPDKDAILYIPNGIDPSFFEPLPRPEEFDFVFVGNMSYPPNIEAVQYIAKHILPEFPDARLLVSGATPHPSLVKLSQSNAQIELTGWVDDIRSSYLNGKIFLAPMTIGTGMQNKLLEAMALRTPCITTTLASKPIGAKDGEQVLVGDTPEAIIGHIKTLLNDREKSHAMALAAQQFVQNQYSWEHTTAELVDRMRQNPRKTAEK